MLGRVMPVLRLGWRCLLPGSFALLAAACVSDDPNLTSPSPDLPWSADGNAALRSFAVSGNPEVADVPAGVTSGRALGLAQLIDLAQRSNPTTRVAWEQARQAAAAVGMLEATYLPEISAYVIGGTQQIVTPVPDLAGGTINLDTTVSGLAPNIALQWLVFDFGQRKALKAAAEQTAYAANVSFNGAHQALIYNVTLSYYLYGAAEQNRAYAEKALANSKELEAAALARFQNGVGNTVEVAQARQLVAQANLRLVQAQDGKRNAYQDLLAAMGVSPRSKINVLPTPNRSLPPARSLPTDEVITAALARRPDVLASYAAVKASSHNEASVRAGFGPKVYAGAIAGPNDVGFQSGNLPGVSGQSTTAGVLIGVTIPIYDGGLRRNRERDAAAQTSAAQAAFVQVRDNAMREIIIASDSLRSAVEAHAAAEALTQAAQTTYDAAFASYTNGVGTITDATAANSGLLDADQARADAYAAALVAASTLAFALGDMTSSGSPAAALR